ncbi:GntR family transcriptional regulator [Larkinella arboricola]|uniref:GntR family transcriptional regulator/GntR family frlABCD operon transcriptional regulator n=1 Tax=Larkinella arboricola TaxID=643671 RepID=A0A327WX11_LARAB|nr:GntR family transcriptional regulator [Larkinella arboricola]RAJ94035.1 GntR family transcriptional regulator/GntR family frlABCD operon transcriptional regulator [Larkinella arboricola]
MTDRPTRIPQYQYLYESLRQQIIRGDFKAGDLLPSEKDLQNQFRLTQPTIRQALGLLVQDGYIRKHQGKGSIVQPLPIGLGVMSIVGRLANTANATRAEGMTTTIVIKPKQHSFPDDFLFTPTEEDTKAGFIYFERLRAVDEEPVFFEKISLPNRYLPGFSRQRLENRSLFDLLRTKYGLLVKGGEQKVLAVTADGELARHLQVSVNTPLLRLDKRLDTNRPDFNFYSSLYARTDRYMLHGRF